MNKRGLLGLIIVMGVLLVVGFFWFVGEWNSDEKDEINDSIQKLISSGDVFKPRRGFIQRI